MAGTQSSQEIVTYYIAARYVFGMVVALHGGARGLHGWSPLISENQPHHFCTVGKEALQMANTFVPRQLSSPALLQSVDPDVLIEFMKRYVDFFRHEKVMPQSPQQIDYDRLSIVLRSPSEDMPPALMADIFYWDEVAEMGNIDDLTDIADKYGIKFSDKVTCAEEPLFEGHAVDASLEYILYTDFTHHGEPSDLLGVDVSGDVPQTLVPDVTVLIPPPILLKDWMYCC
jgi:hypothetical protein